jgi:hypothetical protein
MTLGVKAGLSVLPLVGPSEGRTSKVCLVFRNKWEGSEGRHLGYMCSCGTVDSVKVCIDVLVVCLS